MRNLNNIDWDDPDFGEAWDEGLDRRKARLEEGEKDLNHFYVEDDDD